MDSRSGRLLGAAARAIADRYGTDPRPFLHGDLEDRVQEFSHFLFDDLRFRGNVQNYYEADTTEVAYVMSVKNDRVAVTSTTDVPGQEGGSFIIRGDKKVMWLLNESQKNYVEFPLIEDSSAKDQKVPKVEPTHASLRKTGKSKKILGFDCDEYAGVLEDETSVIWACSKLGRVYDGLFRSLNQMGAAEQPSASEGWQAELVRLRAKLMAMQYEESKPDA